MAKWKDMLIMIVICIVISVPVALVYTVNEILGWMTYVVAIVVIIDEFVEYIENKEV